MTSFRHVLNKNVIVITFHCMSLKSVLRCYYCYVTVVFFLRLLLKCNNQAAQKKTKYELCMSNDIYTLYYITSRKKTLLTLLPFLKICEMCSCIFFIRATIRYALVITVSGWFPILYLNSLTCATFKYFNGIPKVCKLQ